MKKIYLFIKKHHKGITLFLILLFISLPFFVKTKCNILDYNLMDVLTFSVATLLLSFVLERKNEKNKVDNKVENLIVETKVKIDYICMKIPCKEDKKEYLYLFKYISNKLDIIEKLMETGDFSTECKGFLKTALSDFGKIRDFVTDNLNEPKTYFEDIDRKDKIPNLAITVENNLDRIILHMYTDL